MKNKYFILGLVIIFSACACAIERVYENAPNYSTAFNQKRQNRMYSSPYLYSKYNVDNLKRIRRLKNVIKMQKLSTSYLSWDGLRSFCPNGTMTGYSVPINQDIYKQMGVAPYDPKNLQNIKTSPATQELFSMPLGDDDIKTNKRKDRALGGVSGRTGVTIIYD